MLMYIIRISFPSKTILEPNIALPLYKINLINNTVASVIIMGIIARPTPERNNFHIARANSAFNGS